MIRARLSSWIGDDALKRLIKNSSLLFSAEMLVTLIGAIQFPLVSRWLGATEYGVWGIVTGWVRIVGLILSFRLWETVTRYFSNYLTGNDESRALAILKLCLLIDFTIAALTFTAVNLSAEWASALFVKRPDGVDLIRLEALHLLTLVTMSVWMAVLRVFDRFKFISVYNVISAIALFAVTIFMLLLGAGAAGMIVAATVVNLGQTLWLAARAGRELKSRFSRHWFTADLQTLRGDWREIWVMLFSMNIDAFRKIAVNNADIVILGWLSTPAQAGVYQLAKRLASYFGRFTDPIYESLFPEVSRLYAADGPARVKPLIQKLTRGILIGLGVAVTAAYLSSGWIIPLLFGPDYVPAIPVFYVMILTNIWAVCLWAPSVLIAAGKARQLTAINTAASLVMLALLLILTQWWGAIGTAAALVCFHLIWVMLMVWVTRRLLA
jgi:O-antigen/teichoic acid export membrane protein